MIKESILKEKSLDFSVRIVRFAGYLQKDKDERVMSNQVLRSGTSIGANVWEATFAQSNADFISKLSIALKEANETNYWILLLHKSEIIESKIADSLTIDLGEIIAMLIASIKTAKNK